MDNNLDELRALAEVQYEVQTNELVLLRDCGLAVAVGIIAYGLLKAWASI
jgi:hypothetical protein